MKVMLDKKQGKDTKVEDKKIIENNLESKLGHYEQQFVKINSFSNHLINKARYHTKILEDLENTKQGKGARKYEKKLMTTYCPAKLTKLYEQYDTFVKNDLLPSDIEHEKYKNRIRKRWSDINERIVSQQIEPMYSMLPSEIQKKNTTGLKVNWEVPEDLFADSIYEGTRDITAILRPEEYEKEVKDIWKVKKAQDKLDKANNVRKTNSKNEIISDSDFLEKYSKNKNPNSLIVANAADKIEYDEEEKAIKKFLGKLSGLNEENDHAEENEKETIWSELDLDFYDRRI